MALVASDLKSGLMAALGDPADLPTSPVESGQRMADAYADYVLAATSCGGGAPADTNANAVALAAALASVFTTSIDPATTASGMATAFTAFWFSPPLAFTSIPPAGPGVVTAVAGTAVLQSFFAALVPTSDADDAMTRVATALDVFTKTVVVTHPIPGPAVCALPIT